MSSNPQLYSLLIINRAGGLIYSKQCVAHKINTNDLLRIASTFHGINAIAKYSIQPGLLNSNNNKSSDSSDIQCVSHSHGISSVEYNNIRIQSMETLTGMKFLCTSSINTSVQTCERYLHSLYTLYSDYVLKNCFYDIDNPIRVEKFDYYVQQLVST